jgi:hypothetical protein
MFAPHKLLASLAILLGITLLVSALAVLIEHFPLPTFIALVSLVCWFVVHVLVFGKPSNGGLG